MDDLRNEGADEGIMQTRVQQ